MARARRRRRLAEAVIEFDSGDLRKIPEELLIKIWGFLDKGTLRTVRLACRAFLRASIPCIRSLKYGYMLGDNTEPQELAHRLQVLTAVTDLNLKVVLPTDAPVLDIPSVQSALHTLELRQNSSIESHILQAIAPCLAAATGLTTLEIGRGFFGYPNSCTQVANVIDACPALKSLVVWNCPMSGFTPLAEAILRASSLRSLGFLGFQQHGLGFPQHGLLFQQYPLWNIFFFRSTMPGTLFCNLSRLPHLEAVKSFELLTAADVEALASLTQLTCLHLPRMRHALLPMITQLSTLSAMKELHLRNVFAMGDLQKLVRPMPQLRKLSISRAADFGALDSLLASQPAITQLRVSGSPMPGQECKFPQAFLPTGFASLRVFSLGLYPAAPEGIQRLAAALTGLESLSLRVDRRFCQTFLDHLPWMTSLTSLTVSCRCRLPSKLARCPADFLARFPRLVHLSLSEVLGASRWKEDVGYVVALTDLKSLTLSQFTGGDAPVAAEDMLPLTALRQLSSVKGTGCWGSGVASHLFQNAIQSVRYEMGAKTAIDLSS